MTADDRRHAIGAAAEFVENRFKGPTTLREGTTLVGTGSTPVLPNTPERLGWVIVNFSANDGALGFSREVTASLGVPVFGGGGAVSVNVIEDMELPARAVFGIQRIAGATWYHIEILRVTKTAQLEGAA